MNEFEDQLRAQLRRQQPSGDLSQVDYAGLAQPARKRNSGGRRWLIAAIAAGLAVVGSIELYRYRQGQYAKEQLMLALRITSEKTHAAQMKIDEINQRTFLP